MPQSFSNLFSQRCLKGVPTCLVSHLPCHSEPLPLEHWLNHDHTEKKKAYTTTNKRKSFGEPFWPQRETFQVGGGYKNPMKTRKTIHLPPKSFLCGPHFFFGKGNSALEQGGVCFAFPSRRAELKLETGIGGVKSPIIRGGVKILNFQGPLKLTPFYRVSIENRQFGGQKSKFSRGNFRGEFPPLYLQYFLTPPISVSDQGDGPEVTDPNLWFPAFFCKILRFSANPERRKLTNFRMTEKGGLGPKGQMTPQGSVNGGF